MTYSDILHALPVCVSKELQAKLDGTTIPDRISKEELLLLLDNAVYEVRESVRSQMNHPSSDEAKDIAAMTDFILSLAPAAIANLIV